MAGRDPKMNNALKTGFPLFHDEESLRCAINLVCAKYGTVKSLRIFPATTDNFSENRLCLCFLELEPPEAHAALRSELKVCPIETSLAFVADVHGKWNGPTS
jgi:hypothetical protein